MANANNRDFVRGYRKNDAVVPGAKPIISLPLACERFDITAAGFPVLGQRTQDSNRGLAVDSPQLSPRRLGPNESHRKPNSRRTSSCETTFPARTSSRAPRDCRDIRLGQRLVVEWRG
jgi:hypothetical protein